jgi:putative PIN family toxin of toxin-antitoxin system
VRAVLDANIFASALMRPQGPPGQVMGLLLRQRAFELVMSPTILEEVGRVLRYPRLRKRIAATYEELDLWLSALDIIAVPVEGSLDVQAVAADPEDNKYLAAALEGMAEFVVSGDGHLLSLGTYQGVRVVTARRFLETLKQVLSAHSLAKSSSKE